VTGGSLPAVIWHNFMLEATRNLPPRPFPQPILAGLVMNPTTTSVTTTTTTAAPPPTVTQQTLPPQTTQPSAPSSTFPFPSTTVPQGPGPTNQGALRDQVGSSGPNDTG
jgi:penicillin-binding protein 1A